MAEENTNYDALAIALYDRWRHHKPEFPPFHNIKRRERDEWRALAQVAQDEGLLTFIQGVDDGH